MSVIARQSTARTVMVGPVMDADGVAVTDGVVGDLKISKNGAAPAALNGSATLTHRNTGHYSLALTTSDLDTVGQAEIVIDDTTNAMPVKVVTVVEEAVYDALFVASAPGYVANAPVNVAQFGGSNGTFSSGRPEVNTTHAAGTAWGSGAITSGSIANDAITDAKVAADVTIASVTGAVGSVTGNVGGNVTGSVGSVATGGITAASFAADAITAAKIAADVTTEIQAGLATASSITALDGKIDTIDSNVDAILVDTAEIGTAGAGLTNINLPNQTMDIVGNITGNLSGSVGSVTGAVGSVTGAVGSVTGLTASDVGAIKAETDKLADTLEDDAGTYRFTTNALEQAPAGGGGGTTDWTADERTSIRSILGIPGSGTTPADPTTGILDTIRDAVVVVDDLIDTELAAVKTDTAAIKLKTDNLPVAPAATGDIPSAATVASATRTELTTELGRIDAAVSTRATPAQVATELGTYDGPTKAELDAAVAPLATAAALTIVDDFLDTEIAAIKAKTDLIPTDPADQSAVEAAIDAAEAAILAAIPSVSAIEAAILDDANGVETSITPRQALRLILAASAGKLSGAATSTVIIRNVGDSKDRITATVDADGNRAAVTVDAT
jgi:hypothetical protein